MDKPGSTWIYLLGIQQGGNQIQEEKRHANNRISVSSNRKSLCSCSCEGDPLVIVKAAPLLSLTVDLFRNGNSRSKLLQACQHYLKTTAQETPAAAAIEAATEARLASLTHKTSHTSGKVLVVTQFLSPP